ncbi:nucleoside triphosphate pyrophosphatase [Parvularcula sp. IMCC14364]|uniref:Maf family protein n=1 Tax=Parvularcula sp. IMCC14364 TaxID=3067902 RepID=UPI0027416ADD|nr:nucleoside triphosphate pyrophosphatase [Parvularcula sp. IMCC14364]
MIACPLILASKSKARRQLLENAGVSFEVADSHVDEDKIKQEMSGCPLIEIATSLAQAKALAVSSSNPSSYIIGADQILGLKGEGFDKPKSMDEATERLKHFSNKTHVLHTSLCIARENTIIWSCTDVPELKMRKLTDVEICTYLECAGENVLTSVGAYQLESYGIQLFEDIRGSYFSILGLPLLPLLRFLQKEKLTGFSNERQN